MWYVLIKTHRTRPGGIEVQITEQYPSDKYRMDEWELSEDSPYETHDEAWEAAGHIVDGYYDD